MEKSEIKVVELFAGVGGFRLGLENSSKRFKTVWANQWEPNRKVQHAFDCYSQHFGFSENHVNENIATCKNKIPAHQLLVGGFPCQDYSVARSQAQGIEGKKGVLWWEIQDIVKRKKPEFILLENVDRLLKSPASQRGRDFGVMLKALADLGYGVEWRVINAADYGFSQRRRRVFIFGFHKKTNIYKTLKKNGNLIHNGFFSKGFPIEEEPRKENAFSMNDYEDLVDVSSRFSSAIHNSGYMINGEVHSEEIKPIHLNPTPLSDVIHKEIVEEKYFLNGSLDKWKDLKGSKKILRTKPNGENYYYSEGNMSFPDKLELPARTMLTSESSVNRSSHVINDFKTGKLRLLTPIECERLNGFPDNWTNTGMPEKFRYFVMGNALVVPLVTIMGKTLLSMLDEA